MLISVEGKVKIIWTRSWEGWESSSFITLFFDLNRTVCWSIVLKEKSNAGSPYFREVPTDRTPKATKDVNVHFFIHCSISCKLYKWIAVKYTSELREIFEATMYSTCISSWGFIRKKSLTGHPAAGFDRMHLFETEFYDLCHSSDVTWQNHYPQGLTRRTRLFTGNSLLLNLQDLIENIILNGKHCFKCLHPYDRNIRYVLFV